MRRRGVPHRNRTRSRPRWSSNLRKRFQARRAAEKIHIEYEPLQPVVDPERATEQEPIHDENPTAGHGFREDPRPNVLRSIVIRHGDPDAQGDVSVSGVYELGIQDQAFLGPESGLAVPDGEGGVDVYVATQWLHVDRDQVAPCLGLEKEQVRIHLAGVGGAFGGREDLSMQIHGAMLALHTDRPVKLVYSREESFVGHVHRHPAKIWMEHRATREGKLVCVRARILLDGGAYASSSAAVTSNAAAFACGPYRVENALIESTCVYSNNPPCGAMRGFGSVQACFAHEAQMDKLAAELAIDPIELRLLNALGPGDTLPTGQVVTGSLPVAEVIRRAAALPVPAAEELPRDPIRLPGGAGNTTRGEGVRRGVGFAVGFKNVCYSEGFDDACSARVRLWPGADEELVAEVHCAAAEVGQGVTNVILQVARTELGTESVALAPGSTDGVESAGSASASRLTWMAAGAVRLACQEALEEFRRTGGEVDLERTYHHTRTFPLDPETGQVTGDRVHVAYVCAAMRVVAEVDVDLGLTRVVLDRHRSGCRQGDQSAGGLRPDRGRHRAGPRARADGGDPDARRADHERELHRLPDPDHAGHAAGPGGARRGPGAGCALRRERRGRAPDGGLDGRGGLGPESGQRAGASAGPGAAGRPCRSVACSRAEARSQPPRGSTARRRRCAA